MPFKSERQRRFMHARLPEIAARWEDEHKARAVKRPRRRKAKPPPSRTKK